jgi:uncharacterized protein GlcG (DUF336 family)
MTSIYVCRRPRARWIASLALLILTALVGLSAGAQVLMQPNLSATQAQRIVATILAECSLPGDLVTVSVAVVDRAGQPIMQIRADTASPHNYELAFRKAYTARTFRRTSMTFRDQTAGGAENEGQRSLSNIVALGGGVPVMLGEVPIGGVGVSGAVGGQAADTACAEAGIAAIADELE